jgi:pimeloyl-ACP methyl ester carboxylesterase
MKIKSRLPDLFALAAATIATVVLTSAAQAQTKNPYPEELKEWVKGGHFQKINGNDIFVYASGEAPVEGDGVLIVHGYPGSTWDWSTVVPRVAKKTKVVVIDMLGFGQSDKPLDGTYKDNYSLMKQADLYEAVAKAQGLKEVVLVAHDMGQTVGLELMTRQDEGKLSFKIRHAILLNGSSLVDMVELAEMQVELLKLPDQAGTKHLDFVQFREGMRPTFGKGNATDEILNIMTAQVFAKDGDLVMAQTLRYLNERKEFYDRWVGTFANFRTAPLSIYWGVQDPVAVVAMADRIKLWSPTTDVYKIKSAGHWPSIEAPEIIADAIIARLPLYDE